jgi:hypothetical protein
LETDDFMRGDQPRHGTHPGKPRFGADSGPGAPGPCPG